MRQQKKASRKKTSGKKRGFQGLLNADCARMPIQFPNGTLARITMKAVFDTPKQGEAVAVPEATEPFLILEFPIKLTHTKKIETLGKAEKHFAGAKHVPASVMQESAAMIMRVFESPAGNHQKKGAALSQALKNAYAPNRPTLGQVKKAAEKCRGYGSDKGKKDRQKRNDWARKQYRCYLDEKQPPYVAKQLLQSDLMKENFGSCLGSKLSMKTIRKIVSSKIS